jgi:hypothetical protein
LSYGNNVPSDFIVLTDVLIQGIENNFKSQKPLPGKTIYLSFTGGIDVSQETQSKVESFLTSRGFHLTLEKTYADYELVITVSEVRFIVRQRHNLFDRSLSMKIHVQCFNTSQNIVFASSSEERLFDTIPKDHVRFTDDGHHFSEQVQRIVMKETFNRFRYVSFVLITGFLFYFAFK